LHTPPHAQWTALDEASFQDAFDSPTAAIFSFTEYERCAAVLKNGVVNRVENDEGSC